MDVRVDHEPRQRSVPLPERGGAMAFLDFGPQDRPVDVVFSHANGFNARTYRTILAPLARDLRVFAVDLRGHGASSLPAVVEGRPGWRQFAEDLLSFLTRMTAGPVVLAGHSMGATTSLLAAAADPGRVRSLVMFEPVLLADVAELSSTRDSALAQAARRRRAVFPSRQAALEAYRGRGAFKTWSEAQLADYVAAGFKETADGQVALSCAPEWEASNFATHLYDPWAAFASTPVPIRILKAARESITSLGDRLDPLTASGQATVEVAPGATHFLPMEQPDLVRRALRAAVLG